VVFILSIITVGIYGIWWFVTTKGEMVARGAEIPTCWLMIIPIVNWFWLWKWGQGVAKVTGSIGGGAAWALVFFLGPIGAAIIQSKFNAVS
jgi:hypothetical protein